MPLPAGRAPRLFEIRARDVEPSLRGEREEGVEERVPVERGEPRDERGVGEDELAELLEACGHATRVGGGSRRYRARVARSPGELETAATSAPVKDPQTVTAEGRRVEPLIDGVRVRAATTIVDERGTVCELYDPAWGFTEEPLVFVYQITIRPGQVKGWVVHYEQDDRLFFSFGSSKVVLYDLRDESPTRGMVNELCFSEHNRSLLRIPRGVVHAVQNIGSVDAMYLNMPTRPYNHADPDKFRFPLDSPAIPYRF